MSDGDPFRAAAVQVALRSGLLKKCPIHDEVYDPGQHDHQGAFMLAAYLVNQSHPLVSAFGDDRTRLIELLRSICGTYPSVCPQCTPPRNDKAG
jgi:hypothetical protein